VDDYEELPFWEIDNIPGSLKMTGYQQTNFSHIFSSWKNSLDLIECSEMIPVKVEALSDHRFKLDIKQLHGEDLTDTWNATVILDGLSCRWDFKYTD
jgi:hypothetical protein